MSDSTPSKEASVPMLPKWLVTSLSSAIWLLGTGLLERYGDSIFDNLGQSPGKRRTIQLLFLLFCTTAFLTYLLAYKPRPRKLHRWRALYRARRDKHPFCPFCFETAQKRVHLVGPTVMPEAHKLVERWECPVCPHCYASKTGGDFLMHTLK